MINREIFWKVKYFSIKLEKIIKKKKEKNIKKVPGAANRPKKDIIIKHRVSLIFTWSILGKLIFIAFLGQKYENF
jgi:hypothetical protein